MSFVNIYQFVCASSSIGFEIGMKNLIVFVLDHCLSFYFVEMFYSILSHNLGRSSGHR